MDLEEWEYLPDNKGFLDFSHESSEKELFSKKLCFNDKVILEMNYFICPSQSPRSLMEAKENSGSQGASKEAVIPAPLSSTVEKNTDEAIAEGFKDIGMMTPVMLANHDPISQVFFKKMKEDEFVDMKMNSPKSSTRGTSMAPVEPEPIRLDEEKDVYTVEEMDHISVKNMVTKEDEDKAKDCMGSESKEKAPWEGFSISISRWRFTGIGALCSIGVAAATICIFIFGGRQRQKQQHQNQKIQFQIYADDKRIKQAMQQATRLNQALSAVRGAPMTKAHISFGGYYDGL